MQVPSQEGRRALEAVTGAWGLPRTGAGFSLTAVRALNHLSSPINERWRGDGVREWGGGGWGGRERRGNKCW